MPRRREVPKREVLPDPKFGSVEITKFVNMIMLDEFGDLNGTEFRIRENFTFRYFATTGHVYLSFVFSQII